MLIARGMRRNQDFYRASYCVAKPTSKSILARLSQPRETKCAITLFDMTAENRNHVFEVLLERLHAYIGGRAASFGNRICWRGGHRGLALRVVTRMAPHVAAALWNNATRYFKKSAQPIVLIL